MRRGADEFIMSSDFNLVADEYRYLAKNVKHNKSNILFLR